MAGEEHDWREAAFEVYRAAWSELQGLAPRPDLEFYVDELKEALLDLKQATIADDPGRAHEHLNEVSLLLAELRLRKTGDL
jgi:hypothetical protein